MLIMYSSIHIHSTNYHRERHNICSLYFISIRKCLEEVHLYISQNNTLVQHVVLQGVVLFYNIASVLIPIQNILDTKFLRFQYPSKLFSVYILMNGKKVMTMPKAFSLPFINL